MSLDQGNGNQRGRVMRLRTTKQTAAQRKRMEAAVELLISALDALDVTVEDMEEDDPGEPPGDEEPSLGWTDAEARKGVPFQGGAPAVDLEDEHDGSEPSLGAPERSCQAVPWGYVGYYRSDRSGDQSHWSQGARDDREDDPADGPLHDEAELTGIGDADGLNPDQEPSLGSLEFPTNGDQSRWGNGGAEDCEDEHDGREPSLGAVEWPVEVRQVRSADGLTLISRSLHEGSQEAWAAGVFGAGTDGERDECDHEDELQPITLNPS